MKSAVHRVLRPPVNFLEWAAGGLLAFMMLITVLDVSLRAINPLWRIIGVVDMVELALDASFYLALPAVFLARAHVTVDIVDHVVGARTRRVLAAFGSFAGIFLLALMGTQILRPGLESMQYGETTMVLGIPKFAFWLPIWIGLYLSLPSALFPTPGERAAETAG